MARNRIRWNNIPSCSIYHRGIHANVWDQTFFHVQIERQCRTTKSSLGKSRKWLVSGDSRMDHAVACGPWSVGSTWRKSAIQIVTSSGLSKTDSHFHVSIFLTIVTYKF